MLFFRKRDQNNLKKGKMVLTCRAIPQISPEYPLIKFNTPYSKQKKSKKKTNLCLNSFFGRRVSRFSSCCFGSVTKKKMTASITVEASFALPLFLFFCIQMISVLNLLHLHSSMEAALHQEVCKASVQAYAYDRIAPEENGLENLLQCFWIKEKVINRVGKAYLDHSLIEGGSRGVQIAYLQSDTNQDVVDVALCYRVRPAVDLLGFSGFTMVNRCQMKAWTGYRIQEETREGEDGEEYVYVTETGTVYHRDRGCSHLRLSIQSVDMKDVAGLRNEGGGKYYPCENCGHDGGESVYITDQGDRYHSSLGCSGLKRTIYAIPVSQVGGRNACSRCGGT